MRRANNTGRLPGCHTLSRRARCAGRDARGEPPPHTLPLRGLRGQGVAPALPNQPGVVTPGQRRAPNDIRPAGCHPQLVPCRARILGGESRVQHFTILPSPCRMPRHPRRFLRFSWNSVNSRPVSGRSNSRNNTLLFFGDQACRWHHAESAAPAEPGTTWHRQSDSEGPRTALPDAKPFEAFRCAAPRSAPRRSRAAAHHGLPPVAIAHRQPPEMSQ